jgi:hypothetical protein
MPTGRANGLADSRNREDLKRVLDIDDFDEELFAAHGDARARVVDGEPVDGHAGGAGDRSGELVGRVVEASDDAVYGAGDEVLFLERSRV